MASRATKKASVSSHLETHDADECCENIAPPSVSPTTGTYKSKAQEGDVVDCPSTQPSGETKPLSDNCNFATPAPYSRNRGAKAKMRTSNLQSTLTPIFKYINLGVKCQNSQSPEPLKHGENCDLNISSLYHEITVGCCKVIESMSQCPITGFSNGPSARASSHKDPPLFMLEDEVCPEITLLDDTVDSTMPVASPAVVSRHILPESPVSLREMVNKPEEVDDTNADSEMGSCVTLSEMSSVLTQEGENIVMNDSNCLRASLEVTQDIPTVAGLKNNGPSLELSGQNIAEMAGSVTFQSSADNSSTTLPANVTHDISSSSDKSAQHIGKNMMNDSNCLRASLETTLDIPTVDSLKNNGPSLELSGQNMAEMAGSVTFQSSADNSSSSLPGNVTYNISSSGDMSAQCIISQSTASDMQCNNSSKNCTFELQVEPMERSNSGEPNNTKVLAKHEDAITNKVLQPSLKAADSMSSTFTTLQPSELSTPADLNTAVPISCPQNNTLVLPPSTVSNPTAKSEAEDQTCSGSKNTSETCPVMSRNCSVAETSGLRVLQNNTFNMHSLQKPNGNTILGEASAKAVCPQNNDTKPLSKFSGTVALPETSSSISPHNTMNMPSPKITHLTTNPTDNTFEGHPPGQSKLNGITAGTEANAKTVDLCDGTFEAHPVVVPGAERGEAKEHLQSGLPMTDGLSDTLGHQSMDMESNKADTFNLDDSLDLRSDSLVTSTPMPDSKMFNLIAGQGTEKASVVPKRLYGDGPGKIVIQAAASSNIANERAVPSAKSLLPPRAATRLLQYKPVSSIPASCKLPTSGLPLTRQGALRNTAASDALPQETTGTSSSCSGRAAVTGSKQPSAGLRRPRPSSIPAATQRATPSLRPPTARSNVAASSANPKPFGPTVTNPMVSSQAPSQTKQHLFSRTEPLPITKKRKLDASVPSTSADDPVRGARGLKIPATSQRALPAKSQSHGCADCAMYKQQLEKTKEELERVKKELLNYKRRKDEC